MQIINSDRLARRPRAAIVALGLLSAFGPLSLDLYLPSLPRIADDLTTTAGAAQLTLSGSLAGLAVGQLLVGPISDRIGRRRPLLVGLAGFVVLSIVCALAPTIGVLIVARFVQGLCGAAGLVIARAIVRDAYPDEHIADVFSLLMVVNGLAPVLAPLIGGALLHVMPWRGLFGVLTVIGVIIGWLTVLALPETLPPALRQRGALGGVARAAREVARDRLFLGSTGVLALASAMLFTYISLSSFVLQDGFGLSAGEFSAVFAINSTAIIVGSRVSQVLLRRHSMPAVLGVGLAVMTAACLVGSASAAVHLGLVGLLPSLVIAVGSVGIVMPTATALALLRHSRNAGMASALLGSLQYLAGAVVGPVLSVRGATLGAMSAGMTVSAALALGVWAFVIRRGVLEETVVAEPVTVIELETRRVDS
ncbi:multidrug effflux MFS transporter [Flexivirga sp. B27]